MGGSAAVVRNIAGVFARAGVIVAAVMGMLVDDVVPAFCGRGVFGVEVGDLLIQTRQWIGFVVGVLRRGVRGLEKGRKVEVEKKDEIDGKN